MNTQELDRLYKEVESELLSQASLQSELKKMDVQTLEEFLLVLEGDGINAGEYPLLASWVEKAAARIGLLWGSVVKPPYLEVNFVWNGANIMGQKFSVQALRKRGLYRAAESMAESLSTFLHPQIWVDACDPEASKCQTARKIIKGNAELPDAKQVMARFEAAVVLYGAEAIENALEASGAMNLQELRYAASDEDSSV